MAEVWVPKVGDIVVHVFGLRQITAFHSPYKTVEMAVLSNWKAGEEEIFSHARARVVYYQSELLGNFRPARPKEVAAWTAARMTGSTKPLQAGNSPA